MVVRVDADAAEAESDAQRRWVVSGIAAVAVAAVRRGVQVSVYVGPHIAAAVVVVVVALSLTADADEQQCRGDGQCDDCYELGCVHVAVVVKSFGSSCFRLCTG